MAWQNLMQRKAAIAQGIPEQPPQLLDPAFYADDPFNTDLGTTPAPWLQANRGPASPAQQVALNPSGLGGAVTDTIKALPLGKKDGAQPSATGSQKSSTTTSKTSVDPLSKDTANSIGEAQNIVREYMKSLASQDKEVESLKQSSLAAVQNQPIQTDLSPMMSYIDYITKSKAASQGYTKPMSYQEQAELSNKLMSGALAQRNKLSATDVALLGKIMPYAPKSTVTDADIQTLQATFGRPKSGGAPKDDTVAQANRYLKSTNYVEPIIASVLEMQSLLPKLKDPSTMTSWERVKLWGKGELADVTQNPGFRDEQSVLRDQIAKSMATLKTYIISGVTSRPDEFARVNQIYGQIDLSSHSSMVHGLNQLLVEARSIMGRAAAANPKGEAEFKRRGQMTLESIPPNVSLPSAKNKPVIKDTKGMTLDQKKAYLDTLNKANGEQ